MFSLLGRTLPLSATQSLADVYKAPGVVDVRPVRTFAAPEYVVSLGFESR